MALPIVGVLHTARLGKTVKDAFFDGLKDSGQWDAEGAGANVTLDERNADGAYATLAQHARRLKTHAGADLKVVIAAGMAAGKAAVDVWPDNSGSPSTNFPLLIVTGRDTGIFSPRRNTGGVVFDIPTSTSGSGNKQRLLALSNNYRIPTNRVCLLFNKNSQMSGVEVGDWTGNCGATLLFNAASATGDPNDAVVLRNDQINIVAAIAGAAARTNATVTNPGAIIVSADPFFTSQRRAILDAGAGTANISMCYPIFGYLIPKSDKRNLMIYGPLLTDVYVDIGVQTAAILTSVTTATPLPALSMIPATSYYFGRQSVTLSTGDLFWGFWASLFQ
jgi:hypothetical protein